jgi:hypothetical protein
MPRVVKRSASQAVRGAELKFMRASGREAGEVGGDNFGIGMVGAE